MGAILECVTFNLRQNKGRQARWGTSGRVVRALRHIPMMVFVESGKGWVVSVNTGQVLKGFNRNKPIPIGHRTQDIASGIFVVVVIPVVSSESDLLTWVGQDQTLVTEGKFAKRLEMPDVCHQKTITMRHSDDGVSSGHVLHPFFYRTSGLLGTHGLLLPVRQSGCLP